MQWLPHFCIIDLVTGRGLSQSMKRLSLQIARALFRVCAPIKQKYLKERIETHSIYLLEASTVSDLESMERALKTLENLVFLGEEIGEIHYRYAAVLHSQFANLQELLADAREKAEFDVAIADIFSGDYERHIKRDNAANVGKVSAQIGNDQANHIGGGADPKVSNDVGIGKVMSTAERQELVAKKIQELGKAATKDLVAVLPTVSERTLRYDLKKLCERRILERIGGGGPGSYYCLKNKVFARELTDG